MNRYRVGERHPSAGAGGQSDHVDAGAYRSRQLVDLTPGEASDLAESLVRHLSTELEQLGVAGAGQVEKWELAERIRAAVYEHHREVRARAAGPF